MDYEKKYPITQQPGDFVLARWERGYKNVEFFYKDRLLGSVQGAAKLKAGIRLNDTELGVIQAKLSEKPIMMDLIIDGYHSPVNGSHPSKELKKTSPFFWIISVLSFIVGAIEIGSLTGYDRAQLILTAINGTILVLYIVAAIFVGRGKVWAYYLGFVLFSLLFLLNLLSMGSGIGIIFLIIRGAVLGVLIYNLKTVISTQKHAKYGKFISEDLLDGTL